MVSEHEVTEQLITFLRGRSEHGQRKYHVALKPFDGRNSLMDALEEITDLAQYIQKRVMENEAIADLLERAAQHMLDYEGLATCPSVIELRGMAAKLRADCERSVPVDDSSALGKRIDAEASRKWEGTIDLTDGLVPGGHQPPAEALT